MKNLLTTALILVATASAMAGDLQFSNAVNASLVFREAPNAMGKYGYPRFLQVFLRMTNVHDSSVTWAADSVSDIDAELQDGNGKPVSEPPQAASVPSNRYVYSVPYGSRLDWLISHGGVSMMADSKDKIALVVGSRAWLLPPNNLSTYTLHVRLRGVPWARGETHEKVTLILDIPPTRIEISK